MESVLPIIEVVIFHANERCLGDMGLFKEVRDMAAATTRCVQPGSWVPWYLTVRFHNSYDAA